MANKDTGIVNIHGKEYQTVAFRINQFRSAYRAQDGWAVLTEIIHADETVVRIKAMIINSGHILATGHAEEFRADGKINKTSALENAETSAIGRALACFGMGGTEFASADEVARAVSGQKPSAPEPLDVSKALAAMRSATDRATLEKFFTAANKRATDEQKAVLETAYHVCVEVLSEATTNAR